MNEIAEGILQAYAVKFVFSVGIITLIVMFRLAVYVAQLIMKETFKKKSKKRGGAK